MSQRSTVPKPASCSFSRFHFASNRVPQWQTFPLRTLVEDVRDSLAPELASRAILAEIDVPHGQFISADRDMLRRAVLNLVLNAVDAMPGGGELVVTSVPTPWAMELEVADSGPGLSDEVRNRAFKPLFTTKHSGTGLGLTIARQIVEAHGGDITAANCPEGGAAFTLRIPQVAAQKAAA